MGHIVDASVLIVFARAGRLDVLDLLDDVRVPEPVLAETDLRTGADAALIRNRFGDRAATVPAKAAAQLRKADPRLGRGDAALLAAAQTGADTLVSDDRRVRRWADALGIDKTGSIGVPGHAADRIDAVAAFDDLLGAGLYLSADLAIRARAWLQDLRS